MVKNITVWPQEYIGNIFDFKNGLNKAKEFFGSGIPIVNYVDVYSLDIPDKWIVFPWDI